MISRHYGWLALMSLCCTLPCFASAGLLGRITNFRRRFYESMPVNRAQIETWHAKNAILSHSNNWPVRAFLLFNSHGETREITGHIEGYITDPHDDSAPGKVVIQMDDSQKSTHQFPLSNILFMTAYPITTKNSVEAVPPLPEDWILTEENERTALEDFNALYLHDLPTSRSKLGALDLRRILFNAKGQAGRRALLLESEESFRGYRHFEGTLVTEGRSLARIQTDYGDFTFELKTLLR